MNKLAWIVGLLVSMVLCLAPARGQEAYKDKDGPYTVDRREASWHDEARNRDVPVCIYTPHVEKAEGLRAAKFPLIIFSHGMGGSRDGYAYIGKHLASHGYVVIHPTHAGSDTKAIREAMLKNSGGGRIRDRLKGGKKGGEGLIAENTSDPDNLRNRPRDVSFVIDAVKKDEKLEAMTDLERIGVAGHSFGAYTSLAVAGMTVDLPEGPEGGKGKSFREPRVKAVVAMSPQGEGAMGITKGSWEKVAAPVLTLTGTKDYGQGQMAAAWRRQPFDSIKGVPDYIVTIRDASHMTFADNAGAKIKGETPSPDHAKHLRYVKMATTAFFDAYVRGDQTALKWIQGGELGKFDEGACVVEKK